MPLPAIIAGAALAVSAFSSFRAASAQEEAADIQSAGAQEQIALVKEAAKIETISDVEAATSLKEKTALDFKIIDRREAEILTAFKSNEEQHLKNTNLLSSQGKVALLQKQRETARAASTAKSRAAGAGVYAGGGATAEVAKDLAVEGALERARINLQIRQAQQQLDDQISDSRHDAFIALQNIAADRETLAFNFNVASRQQELAVSLREIERESKITSLESGSQVIQAGVPSPALAAFDTALQGLSRMK